MTVLISLRINVLIEIFCQGSLQQHIKRVNYQVAIWKLVLTPKPTVPSPVEGHGWTTGQQGIEPLWVDENVRINDRINVLRLSGYAHIYIHIYIINIDIFALSFDKIQVPVLLTVNF